MGSKSTARLDALAARTLMLSTLGISNLNREYAEESIFGALGKNSHCSGKA